MPAIVALAIGLGLPAAAEPPPTPAAATPPSADQLAWLAGCWGYLDAEPGSGESWMPPAGGMLVGVSRTVRPGRSTLWEYMRIAVGESGGLEFVAQPSGEAEVHFALASLSASEVVFESPAHAFPQRIVYRFAQNGRLSAHLEGTQDGAPRVVDYAMRRVSCDAPPAAMRR
jgi:hypothetical protein